MKLGLGVLEQKEDIVGLPKSELLKLEVAAIKSLNSIDEDIKCLTALEHVDTNLNSIMTTVKVHGITTAIESLIGDDLKTLGIDKNNKESLTSLENFITETANKIWEFIKSILRKIKEFFTKVIDWLTGSDKDSNVKIKKIKAKYSKTSSTEDIDATVESASDSKYWKDPDLVVTSIKNLSDVYNKSSRSHTSSYYYEKLSQLYSPIIAGKEPDEKKIDSMIVELDNSLLEYDTFIENIETTKGKISDLIPINSSATVMMVVAMIENGIANTNHFLALARSTIKVVDSNLTLVSKISDLVKKEDITEQDMVMQRKYKTLNSSIAKLSNNEIKLCISLRKGFNLVLNNIKI